METIRISLPTAFMIETLRANGITDEQILNQIKKKDISPWRKIETTFDFQELINLSTVIDFQSIIKNGYSVKFMTINGLKNLLRLKFDYCHLNLPPLPYYLPPNDKKLTTVCQTIYQPKPSI
ncbi:hypothetical protein [Lederbergia panacisoli]|uniref:hypothetical protein n=1 Tax=Lederbergia panacisoli TaxID=1255251 RepID=UPI00214BC1A9|nr:hypothetical protein [Lederbergia panacisoli]MCR2823684.1 hypothetical protein [Lederbergia panacisoli]